MVDDVLSTIFRRTTRKLSQQNVTVVQRDSQRGGGGRMGYEFVPC